MSESIPERVRPGKTADLIQKWIIRILLALVFVWSVRVVGVGLEKTYPYFEEGLGLSLLIVGYLFYFFHQKRQKLDNLEWNISALERGFINCQQPELGSRLSRFLSGQHEDQVTTTAHCIVTELRPDNWICWFNLGEVYEEHGLSDDAAKAYERAVTLNPDYSEAWCNLRLIYRKCGRIGYETLPVYRRWTETEPDCADAWLALGASCLHERMYKDASVTYRKATELKPDDPYAWYHFGEALQNLGNYDDAVVAFRESIRLKPDHGYASYCLSERIPECYQKQDKHDEAIALYRQVVNMKPDDPGVWRRLGWCYRDAGRHDDAIAAFRRVLELDPNEDEALYGLGCCYREQGRYDEAVAIHLKEIKLDPDYASAWYDLGEAYAGQGKYADAVAAYHKAIALSGSSAMLFTVQRAYLLQGKRSQALEALDHLRKLDPSLAEKLAVSLCTSHQ
jgi:superkiller protein 3